MGIPLPQPSRLPRRLPLREAELTIASTIQKMTKKTNGFIPPPRDRSGLCTTTGAGAKPLSRENPNSLANRSATLNVMSSRPAA